MLRVDRTPLVVRGLQLVWPRVVALGGSTLAMIDGRDQLYVLSDVGTTAMRVQWAERLDWKPAWMRLSPSERYLLLGSDRGNYLRVLDLEHKKMLCEVAGPEHIVAAVGALGDDEVLVDSSRPGRLQVRMLPSLRSVLAVELMHPRPQVWTELISLGGGDRWAMVGHRFLDRDDQLVAVSLEALSSMSGAEAAEVLGGDVLTSAPELVVRPLGEDRLAVLSTTASGTTLALGEHDAALEAPTPVALSLDGLLDVSVTEGVLVASYADRVVVQPTAASGSTAAPVVLPTVVSAVSDLRAIAVDAQRGLVLVTIGVQRD